MKIIFDGDAKDIAALVLAMQERQGADNKSLEREVKRQGLLVKLLYEIMESDVEKSGISLISSQQLNSPSAKRNENVRMLFRNIRELG